MADHAVSGFRGEGFIIRDIHGAHDATDEGELVFGIINCEVAVNAGGVSFDMKDTDTNAVKRSHVRHEVARNFERLVVARAEKFPKAVAHFLRGFVRKSDSENLVGASAVDDEIRDAVSENFGFAGASTSENQNRTLERFDCFLLRRVETSQNQIHFYIILLF